MVADVDEPGRTERSRADTHRLRPPNPLRAASPLSTCLCSLSTPFVTAGSRLHACVRARGRAGKKKADQSLTRLIRRKAALELRKVPQGSPTADIV